MEKQTTKFGKYEKFIIATLTILQFTVILDFMVLSPLGTILLDELDINTGQFGMVVSAYALSAFASGVISSGFADRFDRKKYLLFFYTGFLLGTAMCAMANTYEMLLIARIITGIFGGVIGSVSFAIVTDLFKIDVRGRVMGFLQMGFAASQILGIPIGLALAKQMGWHYSFWMIVITGIPLGVLIAIYFKPVNAHLNLGKKVNPFKHFTDTLLNKEHLRAYAATVLLATGGFMLMPFGSAFSTNNLGLTLDQLPWMYGITGVATMIMSPLIGKISDKRGRFKVFLGGTIISIITVLYYTRMGITPFGICVALNVLLFIGISARIVSSQALISIVPQPQNRGAFMGVNASIQQLAGGISAALAGKIVTKMPNGYIDHYERLGYVVTVTMIVASLLMYRLDKHLANRTKQAPVFSDLKSETINQPEEAKV
ncbi:MAG TPA: MFS transporter [Bacteroidia bacterium]